MPSYSVSSTQKLQTTHQDFQALFNYVIKKYDHTIVFGARTAEKQFGLFKKGRFLAGDAWLIHDKKKVVTYKDGYLKLSRHQVPPDKKLAEAIDVIPYHKDYPHIRWDDKESLYHFAGYVKGVAEMLFSYGDIEHELVWGGNWDGDDELHDQSFYDLVHWQFK